MLENIIPSPKKIQYAEGILAVTPAIYSDNAEWSDLLSAFKTAFKKIYKVEMKLEKGGITALVDPALKAGHYRIECDDSLRLYAADAEGMGYALVSILNAAEIKNDKIEIEKAIVEDYPDKDYRGLMVDLARQWHPFRALLTYVDICYFTKTKYLHLHFIDDQRYTLPTKLYPNLLIEGEHYTFEQIEKLNAYAKARGVIIIPEFEAPGHAAIFNEKYPDVFANRLEGGEGGTLVTEEGAIVTAKNIICPSRKDSWAAIEALLKEISELFPDTPYIHIGADEANHKAWDYCTDCKAYMKEHNIACTKELLAETCGRLAQVVLDLGRTPIIWEGFAKEYAHYIPKETIVISWENHYNFTRDLLADGFKIINCSWQPLYIVANPDHRWGPRHLIDWNIHRWEHWWSNSDAHLNPVTIEPTEQLLGAQVCAWECTFEQDLTPIMEHLPVVAEHCWNNRRVLTWPEYIRRQRPTRQKLAWLIQSFE